MMRCYNIFNCILQLCISAISIIYKKRQNYPDYGYYGYLSLYNHIMYYSLLKIYVRSLCFNKCKIIANAYIYSIYSCI